MNLPVKKPNRLDIQHVLIRSTYLLLFKSLELRKQATKCWGNDQTDNPSFSHLLNQGIVLAY